MNAGLDSVVQALQGLAPTYFAVMITIRGRERKVVLSLGWPFCSKCSLQTHSKVVLECVRNAEAQAPPTGLETASQMNPLGMNLYTLLRSCSLKPPVVVVGRSVLPCLLHENSRPARPF